MHEGWQGSRRRDDPLVDVDDHEQIERLTRDVARPSQTHRGGATRRGGSRATLERACHLVAKRLVGYPSVGEPEAKHRALVNVEAGRECRPRARVPREGDELGAAHADGSGVLGEHGLRATRIPGAQAQPGP